MLLKDNKTFLGLVFIFFFVIQMIIAFVFDYYKLVSIYWIIITLLIFIIGLKLPLFKKKYIAPLIFMLVCASGAIITYFNGNSIGDCIAKSIYAFIGYIGFVFMSEKRINLRLFDVLMVVLYIFFYFVYFSLSEDTRILVDGDLFGHSSTNTIAISLNIVLFIYFILSVSYKEKNKFQILMFAIINLILILIQGSRAGIVVAFLLITLVLANLLTFKSKKIYTSFILLSLLAGVFIYTNIDKLGEFIEIENMLGFNVIEEDIRGTAQQSFMENMDAATFLLGYPDDYEFTFGITRTFNAFLDFWNRYGFIALLFLFVFFLRRIIKHKDYSVPVIYLIPILTYSLVESLWGGTLWDILIYISFFYSKIKNIHYASYLSKVSS